jgi:hypothetical protein
VGRCEQILTQTQFGGGGVSTRTLYNALFIAHTTEFKEGDWKSLQVRFHVRR